jgi:DNA-binding GntR family transcriptional regulator
MEYRMKPVPRPRSATLPQVAGWPGRDARGKATLAQDVYQRLKDDIFEFRMSPGQRYSEHELASSLGVSRTPLRFALHALAHEGYLNRVEGHSSWQVKPLDLGYYEDLYDFRLNIEALAVHRLCKLDVMQELASLGAFWRVAKNQRVLDGRQVAAEDERFHRSLVALAGNLAMLRAFDDLTERIRIIRRLDFINPERIEAAYNEHRKILETLLARKAASAEMLVKAHIDTSRAEIRHITLHRLSLAASRDGHALER